MASWGLATCQSMVKGLEVVTSTEWKSPWDQLGGADWTQELDQAKWAHLRAIQGPELRFADAQNVRLLARAFSSAPLKGFYSSLIHLQRERMQVFLESLQERELKRGGESFPHLLGSPNQSTECLQRKRHTGVSDSSIHNSPGRVVPIQMSMGSGACLKSSLLLKR